MVDTARKYAKFIVALVVAVAVTLMCLEDGVLTETEIGAITVTVLGALGVRQIPNDPM